MACNPMIWPLFVHSEEKLRWRQLPSSRSYTPKLATISGVPGHKVSCDRNMNAVIRLDISGNPGQIVDATTPQADRIGPARG
jgi:hypothetical protein